MRQYAKQSSDDPYGKNDISRRYEDNEDVIHDARCTAKDCKHDIHDLEQCYDLTLFKRQYQEMQKRTNILFCQNVWDAEKHFVQSKNCYK